MTGPELIDPRCPGCGHDALSFDTLLVPDQPVVQNYPFTTRQAACAAPRRDIALKECARCGLVFNTIFDATAFDYDDQYENSQNASPTFRSLLRETAARLADSYSLQSAPILEVGCGKGYFLRLLCRHARTTGIGYDTSCELDGETDGRKVRFYRRYVGPEDVDNPLSLVVCRHVIEHVPAIGAFLRMLFAIAKAGGDCPVYLETPDWHYITYNSAFYDILYEHCNYFSLPTLEFLARHAGFTVINQRTIFFDQYQAMELRPDAEDPPRLSSASRQNSLRNIQSSFASKKSEILALVTNGRATASWAIWGAGGKGVCLANAYDDCRPAFLIDSNQAKHGRFIPGVGLPIVSPSDSRIQKVETILVPNPVYLTEIREALESRDCFPRLVSLWRSAFAGYTEKFHGSLPDCSI